jgi:hypothetical protein
MKINWLTAEGRESTHDAKQRALRRRRIITRLKMKATQFLLPCEAFVDVDLLICKEMGRAAARILAF